MRDLNAIFTLCDNLVDKILFWFLHFCRLKFSTFGDFKAFFVLLTRHLLDIAPKRVAIGGDFK